MNRKGNKAKSVKVAEDLAAMRELNAAKLPEFVELQAVVSSWSTVQYPFGERRRDSGAGVAVAVDDVQSTR